MWILSSREKVLDIWCEVFMESFRAYLKQTKIFFIACVFMAAVSTAVICLYQLPLEAAVYLAVLWLGAGAAVFLYGYACYRQKVQNLILVEKAPEINLDRLGETTDEVELLYRDIIRKLDGMRMGAETERQRSLEEMTDYYTMWAHQIKTPIFALRLLLREEPEENRESLAQLFRIEQYVEMVLGYLRLDSESTDYVLRDTDLDGLLRQAVRKFARMFILKKITLDFRETGRTVLTDGKWLSFVVEQVLSNALKYTPAGGRIRIYGDGETLVIVDSGIGIRPEDLPRVFEKGFTGYNGREDKKSTGIGLYLCRRVMDRLNHGISIVSRPGQGTLVRLDLSRGRRVVE